MSGGVSIARAHRGKVIAQFVTSELVADASAIEVASGWVDVLSAVATSRGGSSVCVQGTAVGSPTVGDAQVRLRINGGSFSNLVIGATYYELSALLTHAVASFTVPLEIPDTSPDATEYTFTLQMQAQGIIGTVTPRLGTVLTVVEYR